jgi:hypothetical protein
MLTLARLLTDSVSIVFIGERRRHSITSDNVRERISRRPFYSSEQIQSLATRTFVRLPRVSHATRPTTVGSLLGEEYFPTIAFFRDNYCPSTEVSVVDHTTRTCSRHSWLCGPEWRPQVIIIATNRHRTLLVVLGEIKEGGLCLLFKKKFRPRDLSSVVVVT